MPASNRRRARRAASRSFAKLARKDPKAAARLIAATLGKEGLERVLERTKGPTEQVEAAHEPAKA